MNRAIIIGNLTRDPELRKTNGDLSVCNFTVAVNRPRAKDGTQTADYINVQTWRTLADNCYKYLGKGRKVAVEGRIQTRSWDAQDGSKRYATEVVAETVEFLDRGGSTQNNANSGANQGGSYDGYTEVDDSQLPF